ncbi:CBS domain-containing protein [Pseudonocardia sp. H11422]|uniref:CBS domain-containing protein n=1 Tax=Pseudonocardia sp. H11422 TaxID=2835866 RepID=UPI001BDD2974|nr:CBS domain-containing protein [Pseudonocardia sp. H11422]
MRIADVLRRKGDSVATVGPSATVAEVIGDLAVGNYGALPVVEDGRLVGIVSERDVVRRLHERGPDLLLVRVAEIMTVDVVTCSPTDSAVDLSRVMTERRVRHVPVVVEGELRGIVSIGDLVKARIDTLEEEREQLASYIAG